jgi:hypothetical protein
LSREFLRRHGEASGAAAAAVRTAADALATLRDNLWHTVDGKVAAAISADDRAPDEWLAAANTVTTGAGDRAAASERIDREVKPFVDNDIRADWLTAMRSAMAAVMNLYDAATAELTAESDGVFEVPGELGPAWTPPPRDDDVSTTVPAAAAVAPAGIAPQSWAAPTAPSPMPMQPLSSSSPPMPAPPVAPVDAGSTAPAMAAPPSTPSLGGMPGVGGGLSGFGQQLADAFGSLLGSADDALSDPDIDDPELDDDVNDDVDDELDDDAENDDESVDPAADLEEEPPVEESVTEPVDAAGTCEPAETPAPIEPPPAEEPAPTPVAAPPPPEPAPVAEPAAPADPTASETPCEIAADELPQVGE